LPCHFCWLLENVRLLLFLRSGFSWSKITRFLYVRQKVASWTYAQSTSGLFEMCLFIERAYGSPCKKWKGLTLQILLWWLPDWINNCANALELFGINKWTNIQVDLSFKLGINWKLRVMRMAYWEHLVRRGVSLVLSSFRKHTFLVYIARGCKTR